VDVTATDIDPTETREWLEAYDAVLAHDGDGRAAELLHRVVDHARLAGEHADV
jgi:pyruvate dehydrogenase E1 component